MKRHIRTMHNNPARRRSVSKIKEDLPSPAFTPLAAVPLPTCQAIFLQNSEAMPLSPPSLETSSDSQLKLMNPVKQSHPSTPPLAVPTAPDSELKHLASTSVGPSIPTTVPSNSSLPFRTHAVSDLNAADVYVSFYIFRHLFLKILSFVKKFASFYVFQEKTVKISNVDDRAILKISDLASQRRVSINMFYFKEC